MNTEQEISKSKITTLVGPILGLVYYAWDLSFNFGAFGVIFLGHILSIWLFSLSILLITIVVQKNILPGQKSWGYFILSLPTIWLILKIIDDPSEIGQIHDLWIHIVAILALTISLPYVVYVFFRFTNPQILLLKRRLIIGLVGIFLFVALIGYTLGQNNQLIMTCQNFIVSGQDTPQNCINVKK
ncbi:MULTISPECIES: hypothetical protein [Okeania]|uniref:hypothetical protein n=1 Tax=Okeania TaxID=1458928 RepID=UPI000F53BAC8|nr:MULTISPECIES: hypothetical protein [Okeania]NES87796.1 hypothetical protein [Okeania sp. SIO2B9]RQH06348.1 hypothetical protein D4Z78_30140 [Okeania hirsuta]